MTRGSRSPGTRLAALAAALTLGVGWIVPAAQEAAPPSRSVAAPAPVNAPTVVRAAETTAAAVLRAAPAPTTAPAALDPRAPGPSPAELEMASGLIGSKHDFTRGAADGRALCLPCHQPHVISAAVPALDRRPSTAQPLRPYQALGLALDGWSLLCLGCHDGVLASDVFTSAHAIAVAGPLGDSRLGVRGLRSHPVGVRYPVNDPAYHPPAAVEAAGLRMPDGRIQCTTCHDAHNTRGYAGMLHVSNERSRLCLTCHRL